MMYLLCFSAEASFAAAILLGVLGYATLSETKDRRELLLACVPLLFAAQQFSEGILWISLTTGHYPSVVADSAKWIFLVFAFVNWPIWLPASLLWIEREPVRKYIILASLFLGIAFVALNLSLAIGEPVTVGIVDSSIQYSAYDTSSFVIFATLRVLYILAVLIPAFTSSYRLMWVFGLIVASTFILAEYFYHAVFTSVWCFFAAVTSASLFVILRKNRAYQG
jgi:hypothetical protein